MKHDVFRPRHAPARLIYDAFQAEAEHRNNRTVAQWRDAESLAVWTAARDWAQQNNRRAPTMDEIKDAERFGYGHVDYGAKWAYAVAELLERNA